MVDTRSTYGERLLFSLSVIHLLHGELEQSRQTSENLVRSASTNNHPLMQNWGHYLLGRVYQEWNQLELAASFYKLVVDQRFTSNLFCSLESIAGDVYILQTLGRREQAQQSMDLLLQFYSEQIAATPAPMMFLIAWLNLQNGNRQDAYRWAASFCDPVAKQAIIWFHVPQIYKAKILIESSDWPAPG
jgi:tetratricopeptide (TPR) repeat protein